MKRKIKICGVKEPQDISVCNDIGVDFIGFNFANISPRKINPKYAKEKKLYEYTEEELSKVFDQDFIIAGHGAETLMKNNEVYEIEHEAKCVLIEMVFQLGIGGVSKFKNMWKALGEGDYQTASEEMLDSRWAKQTPKRAEGLSAIMKSCKI